MEVDKFCGTCKGCGGCGESSRQAARNHFFGSPEFRKRGDEEMRLGDQRLQTGIENGQNLPVEPRRILS